MGIVAAGVTIATGVISYSQQKAQGKAQKAWDEANAKIAELQAVDAEERGDVAADDKALDIKSLIGQQKASFGAQGIDVREDDSTGHLLLSSAEQGKIDILRIKNNAAREAWGYRNQAADYQTRGRLNEKAAKNQATSTILTSFATGASQYRQGNLSVPKKT